MDAWIDRALIPRQDNWCANCVIFHSTLTFWQSVWVVCPPSQIQPHPREVYPLSFGDEANQTKAWISSRSIHTYFMLTKHMFLGAQTNRDNTVPKLIQTSNPRPLHFETTPYLTVGRMWVLQLMVYWYPRTILISAIFISPQHFGAVCEHLPPLAKANPAAMNYGQWPSWMRQSDEMGCKHCCDIHLLLRMSRHQRLEGRVASQDTLRNRATAAKCRCTYQDER